MPAIAPWPEIEAHPSPEISGDPYYSLPALGFARDAVRRGMATSLREGLEIEADLNTLAFQTADAVEGMTAYLEKRKPVFRDG